MEYLLTADALISLLTLTILEVVLGVDNVIFVSIIMGRLDNSVIVEQLVEKQGVLMTPDAFKKRFGNEPMPHFRILNVEDKK